MPDNIHCPRCGHSTDLERCNCGPCGCESPAPWLVTQSAAIGYCIRCAVLPQAAPLPKRPEDPDWLIEGWVRAKLWNVNQLIPTWLCWQCKDHYTLSPCSRPEH